MLPQFFFQVYVWLEYIYFNPFTFSLCRSFVVMWVCCRQLICFLIHSATLCLFIGAFSPFTVFKKIYLSIFSERGRKGEREGEKHQCVVASHVPAAEDLAHNPSMCPDSELNQQLFGSQALTQSTKLYQPRLTFKVIIDRCLFIAMFPFVPVFISLSLSLSLPLFPHFLKTVPFHFLHFWFGGGALFKPICVCVCVGGGSSLFHFPF